MKYLTLKNIAAVLGIIITALSIVQSIRADYFKQEKDRALNNLYEKTIQYQDKEGRLVIEKMQIEATKDELQAAYTKEKHLRNNYEKKLAKIAEELMQNKLKMRNVEAAGTISTESQYSDVLILHDTIIKAMPVLTGKIQSTFQDHYFEFNPENNTLKFDSKMRQDVFFSLIRKPKTKLNGKHHFPNWGRIWGWEHFISVKTLSDSTEITELIYVKLSDYKK